MYTITVTNVNTNETFTVSTSVMAYLKLAIAGSKDPYMVNLAKAMYYYNDIANEYFGK